MRRENERRSKVDFWVVFSRVLAIVGWLLFIVALVVSFYAAPEIEYGIVRFHGLEVRKIWQPQLTNYLYATLWFSAFVSLAAVLINRFRARRMHDINHNFNLILLLLITIAWVVYIYFDIQ